MDQLEVLGEDEKAPEQGEEGHGDRAGSGRERPRGEDPQIDERLLDAELPRDEDSQSHQAPAASASVPSARPAVGRRFDDGVDDRQECAADQQRADDVKRAPAGSPSRALPKARPQSDRDDRDVHRKDAAPREVREQQATRGSGR